ncbi:MAG: RidA family protein [Rickettsiales bacterium]|jgi:enamine deaminase RidA (YjgF/YER057c/UK114 family)|nr:RidA family protein [Rickettsiales bacterium]
MNRIDQKLSQMQITLPASSAPVANYVHFVITGSQVFVSGQLPMKDGKAVASGQVGKHCTVEEAQLAARQCGINMLSHLKEACGGNLDRIKRCVKLGVFVSSGADFTDQPKVANGVSDFIVEVFGEAGKHTRAAVGVSQLPFNVAVEVDGIFEID